MAVTTFWIWVQMWVNPFALRASIWGGNLRCRNNMGVDVYSQADGCGRQQWQVQQSYFEVLKGGPTLWEVAVASSTIWC